MVPFNRGGWVAVDLFFVLSGFLVSGLLYSEYKKNGQIKVKRFLIRRGFKIYPPFIFFMLFTFIAELICSHYTSITSFPVQLYINDLFFLHNYLGGRWDQTWSLDVEEFFYLVVPFFFYFSIKYKKLNLSYLTTVYVFLAIIGIAFRWLAIVQTTHYDTVTQYTQTHSRLDGIFLGLLLSYIYNFNPEKLEFVIKYRVILATVSAIFLASEFFIERQDHLWEAVVMPAVNPLVFAVFTILALNTSKIKSNFIGYIGQQSYGIYLWHFVFVYYMGYFVTKTKMSVTSYSDIVYGMPFKTFFILYIIVYFILSIATGIFFTRLIETRVLKIRDKLYPSGANNIISEKP